MKSIRLGLALFGLIFAANSELCANESETKVSEQIEQVVREAQRVAFDWAKRFQERSTTRSGPQGPYVGVVIESVSDALRAHLEIPAGVGLLISKVRSGSPAEEAGLRGNDVLVRFNDQLIMNFNQFSTLVNLHGTETPATFGIIRGGKSTEVLVQPIQRLASGTQGGEQGSLNDTEEPLAVPFEPTAPESPKSPASVEDSQGSIPVPLNDWLASIEDALPGALRLYVDDNEQMRIELQSLKDDIYRLRKKFRPAADLSATGPTIIRGEEDGPLRTTIIHDHDKQIRFSTKNGHMMLRTLDGGSRWGTITSVDGTLVYSGKLEESEVHEMPAMARDIFEAWQVALTNLGSAEINEEIAIEFKDDKESSADDQDGVL